ncbi:MAG: hypothetical protein KKB66_15995 [Alphaproteobacteria bacterium]|nr:hypothetical protein [Alphaproteobacteria bacterium]MBU0804323.1 hypothetical protein [Alphaproteobacteria bacterium]MBU0871154.1 hypothetical protein [Alphaproteobacteria bacterium]MBU1400909.1 hypothetical protein [Alphaproteobacteria bacterium]MBU1592674.1 hypothetical protein [Alphaproteobacteria bacterium]
MIVWLREAASAAWNSAFFWQAAGGVLTAALAAGGAYFAAGHTHRMTERRLETERRRHAEHLAVTVLLVLDPFVIACASVACDKGDYDERGELETTMSIPTLSIPADVDWKSISADLAFRIRSLPNKLQWVANNVRGAADGDHPPDYEFFFEARREEYAKLGLSVLEITEELRRCYRLSDTDGADDAKGTLRLVLAEVESERQERIKRNAEWAERMVTWRSENISPLDVLVREAAPAAVPEDGKEPQGD